MLHPDQFMGREKGDNSYNTAGAQDGAFHFCESRELSVLLAKRLS